MTLINLLSAMNDEWPSRVGEWLDGVMLVIDVAEFGAGTRLTLGRWTKRSVDDGTNVWWEWSRS